MAEYITKQQVINKIANTNFKLSADDWSEITDAIDDIPTADVVEIPNGMTRVEVEHRLSAKVCNDYVERSEYERLQAENKELKRIVSDKVDEDLKCAFELKELRKKIDKAIQLSENLIDTSLKLRLYDVANGMTRILEVFKRNIGE